MNTASVEEPISTVSETPVLHSLPMRVCLLLLLLCCCSLARAEWTGVAFEIGDMDNDWDFDGTRQVAKSQSLRLLIEERTASGLAVGGALGYLSTRVRAGSEVDADSIKFEAEHVEVYLRQDWELGESFGLHALFSYGYYNGRENSSDDDRAEIDWSMLDLEFGASFRHANLRITPFISYADVDGDVSGGSVSGTREFELDDPDSYGVQFDIFVERTAFIAIRLQAGSQNGGTLSFVRRYD